MVTDRAEEFRAGVQPSARPRSANHSVGYNRPVCQVIITDLGHEEPTILLTN